MLDPDTRGLSLCPTSAKQKHQQDKKRSSRCGLLVTAAGSREKRNTKGQTQRQHVRARIRKNRKE